MKRKYYFIILFCISSLATAEEIKPFTTDGCSSFPEGTITQQSLWATCCIRHDLAYWQGGTYEQRLEADKALEACVEQVGEPDIAKLMLAGVRIGGSPYYPTSYRWGYGWSYPRGYKSLTKEETKEVKEKLKMFELLIKSITEELKLAE